MLAVALHAHSAAADALPWEIWTSPATLALVTPDDQVLERSSHCLDGCRFDRSNAGAETPADNPYPARWIYSDGAERVVFDDRGAGAVTRIWMTTGFGISTCIDPAITVRFYVDGAPAPALAMPLASLFDGSTPPFTPPLVADATASSGGYVSYVPIAYARSLRITLANIDNGPPNPCTGNDQRLLWFQFTHHRLPPSTTVTGFDPAERFDALRAFMAHAGDDPWNGLLQPIDGHANLHAGESVQLARIAGAGWLRGIRLKLPRDGYAHIRLQLAFDGSMTVDEPLDAFFAQPADDARAARSVLLGEDTGGWLYGWFPMPFERNVEVSLAADPDLPAPVAIDSALAFDAQPVPEGTAHFVATTGDACIDAGDLMLYDRRGAGRVVAMSARYAAAQGDTRGYLEGDERAYIDGAVAPSWYGTGVEDFYDSGFYFDHGPYALPFSGATEVDASGDDTTSAYRLLLTDPLAYGSHLRFTQEAGFSPSQPVPTCARWTILSYATPRSNRFTYDRFEVGDSAQANAHAYTVPTNAACALLAGEYESEPPVSRSAVACGYASGSSHFHLHAGTAATSLRLRRTFDAGTGTPGLGVGSPPALILVDGVEAGWFPPVPANPPRRWQEQDIPLPLSLQSSDPDIEIVPDFEHFPQSRFTESAWELTGGWRDSILADGFDPNR